MRSLPATSPSVPVEQMELEFFCKPGTDLEWFKYWKDYCHQFLLSLGMKDENIRLRDHEQAELSHYSNATTDIEFLFPFGWGELWGIADRTNFDLTQHQTHSGKSCEYFDPETNEKYIPYVIEPSLGADRVALAFLCDAYDEEEVGEGDVRTVLRLHPALAPYKAAVLPLSKKLSEPARERGPSWLTTSWWTTMRPVPLVSGTAVKMRSVLRSASPTTSRARKMAV